MSLPVLGIDVSKDKLHLALLTTQDARPLHKTCPNSTSGYQEMVRWLQGRKVAQVWVCLEATGWNEEAAAAVLVQAGHLVSLLNPHAVRQFAAVVSPRTKTDKKDAEVLALYGLRNQADLKAWQPPPSEYVALRDLIRRRQALVEMRTQELNRLHHEPAAGRVLHSLEEHVQHLDKQIQAIEDEIDDHLDKHPELKQRNRLLQSIPGVSLITSAWFLGEVGTLVDYLDKPRQLLAYCGMTLKRKESGTSVRGKPKMCKYGNRQMRGALGMPAKTAIQHNPVVKKLAERLLKREKHWGVVVGAAMAKLLTLMF
ncbi:MAG: IS110 family transposase, partial [Thermomicrobium sp.]